LPISRTCSKAGHGRRSAAGGHERTQKVYGCVLGPGSKCSVVWSTEWLGRATSMAWKYGARAGRSHEAACVWLGWGGGVGSGAGIVFLSCSCSSCSCHASARDSGQQSIAAVSCRRTGDTQLLPSL
jgi:hypothetical protein